jgi:Fanconi anemia group M protein
MFNNIFSKRKSKRQTKESPKVIADIHEKDSLVISSLIENKIEVEIKNLEIGDYIIRDVIIERKTLSDFISSMISKRLIKQLLELQRYKKRFLILEGEIDKASFNQNAIRGMILSIELDIEIPIIFTKNSEETSRFLEVLARKKENNQKLSFHSRKGLTKKQIQSYIIESFPNIGPKTAEKLLKEFKTIKNLINQPIENLNKIIGKKSETFKIIEEEY